MNNKFSHSSALLGAEYVRLQTPVYEALADIEAKLHVSTNDSIKKVGKQKQMLPSSWSPQTQKYEIKLNLPSIRKATRVNQFQEKYVINKSMFIQKKVSADKYLKLSTLERLKNASENVSVIKDHSDKPKKNSSVMRPQKKFFEIATGSIHPTLQFSNGRRLNMDLSSDAKGPNTTQQRQNFIQNPQNQHLVQAAYPQISERQLKHYKHNHKPSTHYPEEDHPNRIKNLLQAIKKHEAAQDQLLNAKKYLLINTFSSLAPVELKERTKKKADECSQVKQTHSKSKKQSKHLEKPKTLQMKSWKSRSFPLVTLTKAEAILLFRYHLRILEVVPIVAGYYRVYIGEGNNGQLIGKLLKNRGFWIITSDTNQANLIWTQLPIQNNVKTAQNLKLKARQNINPKNNPNAKENLQEAKSSFNSRLQQFLQLKSTDYLQMCRKVLDETTFTTWVSQIFERFKGNLSLKEHHSLLKSLRKYLPQIEGDIIDSKSMRLYNHVSNSEEIGFKKSLSFHLNKYSESIGIDPRQIIPETLHLDYSDPNLLDSQEQSLHLQQQLSKTFPKDCCLILKPGEGTNRGYGISVHLNKSSLLHQAEKIISSQQGKRTFIIQLYITPLLYMNRKFDIRMWVLYIGNKAWLYREGYIRTSSKQFTLKSTNKYVHLTNDAVQKHSQDYGKYQPANKLSFADMDRYLRAHLQYQGFYSHIYQSMQNLSRHLFSIGNILLQGSRSQFELFGLDFMIDDQFKVWLIECNSNPCLETGCSLLAHLIPNMLDNVLNLAVDPYFGSPEKRLSKEEALWQSDKFNFELLLDGQQSAALIKKLSRQGEYWEQLKALNREKLKYC